MYLKNKRAWLVALVLFLCMSVLDLWIRSFCRATSCNVGWKLFGLEFFQNDSFVFSLPLSNTWSAFVSALVLLVIVIYLYVAKIKLHKPLELGLVLLLGFGAINLFDRLYFGFVTDYIKVLYGYYNLADIGILICLVYFFISSSSWYHKLKPPQ